MPVMRAFALLFAIVPLSGLAQDALQSKIAAIAKDAQGTVSVSCMLPGTKLDCDLNPHNHPPMQSMYKYPLALTALHLAETGKLLPISDLRNLWTLRWIEPCDFCRQT
jgi:hypothetical protein